MTGTEDDLLIDPRTGRARRLDLVPADLSEVQLVVLYGGRSGEREVSLQSGEALVEAFEQALPPSRPQVIRRVVVETDGRWTLLGESPETLAPLQAIERLRAPRSLFFLGLHGGEGEDGTLQGLLRSAGLPHTGSGVGASALCMDKRAALTVLGDVGIATCSGLTLSTEGEASKRDLLGPRLESLGSNSFFVKPNDGGSSVATFRVEGIEAVHDSLVKARELGVERVRIEPEVRGVEVSCGVLSSKNPGGPLRTLPPVEICPHPGRFFDYEEKYSSSGAEEVCPPRSITVAQSREVEAAAALAFESLGCEGYARIDFIVPAAGGAPVCLEANTLPGFTPRSLLPLEAAVVGVDFSALCVEVARLALRAFDS